jgi:hypothetical protein
MLEDHKLHMQELQIKFQKIRDEIEKQPSDLNSFK